MDTNKEYVSMCKNAVEIQKLWKWKLNTIGDYCWLGENYLDCAVGIITKRFIQLEGRIWLPRQDQLQEIIIRDNLDYQVMFYKLYHWTFTIEESLTTKFNSMEQLWLAFVMKEKYNKTWNGEDWRSE